MKTVTPDYYDEFKCIADKCTHSCCVGWEIDIDEKSYENYMNADSEFGERLRKNISTEEGTAYFVADKSGRCPFLNNKNLCDIYIELGENSLCQICSDHPRFRNYFDDRIEIGLGLCCEVAGRLILGRKEKMMVECGEDDFMRFRQSLFDILQNREVPLEIRLNKVLAVCNITLPDISFDRWAKVYMSLERLDEAWAQRLEMLANAKRKQIEPKWETAFEQLAVYFVFRHLADGLNDGRIAERAAFAVLSVNIIKAMFSGESFDELIEIARQYSSEIEYCEENMENILGLLEQF